LHFFLVRTLLELVQNEIFYHNRFAHIVGPINEAIKNIARNYSYSELYEIAGLSNILKCNIRSIYPRIDYRQDLNIMNSTFEYARSNLTTNIISIFWTHTKSETYVRNNNSGNWTPNHFVPLVLSSSQSKVENSLSLPTVLSSGSVSLTFT
jgi:hypothetical protein